MFDALIWLLIVGAIGTCIRVWWVYFSLFRSYRIGNGDLYPTKDIRRVSIQQDIEVNVDNDA